MNKTQEARGTARIFALLLTLAIVFTLAVSCTAAGTTESTGPTESIPAELVTTTADTTLTEPTSYPAGDLTPEQAAEELLAAQAAQDAVDVQDARVIYDQQFEVTYRGITTRSGEKITAIQNGDNAYFEYANDEDGSLSPLRAFYAEGVLTLELPSGTSAIAAELNEEQADFIFGKLTEMTYPGDTDADPSSALLDNLLQFKKITKSIAEDGIVTYFASELTDTARGELVWQAALDGAFLDVSIVKYETTFVVNADGVLIGTSNDMKISLSYNGETITEAVTQSATVELGAFDIPVSTRPGEPAAVTYEKMIQELAKCSGYYD